MRKASFEIQLQTRNDRGWRLGVALPTPAALRSAFPTVTPFRKGQCIATNSPDMHQRAEIPSKRLVLLHIHECKSGPRTTALDSEILDLGII